MAQVALNTFSISTRQPLPMNEFDNAILILPLLSLGLLSPVLHAAAPRSSRTDSTIVAAFFGHGRIMIAPLDDRLWTAIRGRLLLLHWRAARAARALFALAVAFR